MCDETEFPQTQIVNDAMSVCQNESYDSTPEDENVWGKLFPNGKSFELFLLNKEIVTCGRRPDADIKLKSDSKHVTVGAYSSLHFTITREKSSKDEYYVKIQDNSSNGTFINGNKIGKGRFQILKSNDEISLSKPENKAFTFVDKSINEDNKWPLQVRDKYNICKELGKGAYGEVRLAFSNQTMEKFAVKIISKKKFTIRGKNEQVFTNSIMTEVSILKKLDHPCIIKIYEVIDTPDRVFIVLELVEGGELFDKVASAGQYEEKTAKLLFYQMVLAIKYLHDQGISHRDLKPENILLYDKENNETLIKVTDFGLSKFFDSATVLKTFCGTPNYLAPEVLVSRGGGSYTNKVDNWSLGVILYILLVGYPPFSDENTSVTLEQQICKGSYTFPTQYWSTVSKDAIDLIKNLLQIDPDKRYSLEQVLNHKWIKNDKNMKTLADSIMKGSISSASTISSKNDNQNKSNLKRNIDDKHDSELYNEDLAFTITLENTNGNKRLKTSSSDSTEKSSDLS